MYDAVHRALDAGAHVVLASGRSPHGMTGIADLLDLHGRRARTGSGSSRRNGAVLPLPAARGGRTRRPSTPRRPSRAVLEQHPNALVAVEERGVGYRVNAHFPRASSPAT